MARQEKSMEYELTLHPYDLFPLTVQASRPPDFANRSEAYHAAYKALKNAEEARFYRKRNEQKRDFDTASRALLWLMDENTRLQDQNAMMKDSQEGIMATMETVRDRNRHLEEQMHKFGLTTADINRRPEDKDSKWEQAIKDYARRLFSFAFSLGEKAEPGTFYLLSQAENADRVAKLMWSAMEEDVRRQREWEV